MAGINVARPANLILQRLDAEAWDLVREHLRPIEFPFGETLHHARAQIEEVYFPEAGIASILVVSSGGMAVEVAAVGNEGIVGIPAYLGTRESPFEVIAQITTPVQALRVGVFRRLVTASANARPVLNRYCECLLAMMAQSTLCARLHRLSARTARWLLISRDRIGRDEFPLTQDLLAVMLGAHRPNLSKALGALTEAGYLAWRRGRVTILDGAGVEAMACECYAIIRDEYERILGVRPPPR